MKKFDKKTQIKIFKIILIIIWMIAIFIFSSQQGTESGNTSRNFTKVIIQILTGNSIEVDNSFVEGIQLFVRKMAHFTIYTVGGFLIMNYNYTTDKKLKQKILYSIVFGTGYAMTDELHQLFVAGRSGSVFDVGIDSLGIITGVGTYLILRKIIEVIIKNKKTKLI